ncbi:MAG: CoA transferase [Dehalococcoidia bacterium]|nr:CoA transferase [Dehalococcoidia bacterium]
MAGALDDIRVIDATGPIGHYAGYLLADLGADVVKVEPLEGDPARRWPPLLPDTPEPEAGLQFLLLNVNKRGAALDLGSTEGREAFLRMVAGADVLLESWSAREAEVLGLTPDVIEAANPNLVHASVTGWGLSGPYAEWAYADIVALAMSGVMNLAGFPDGPPEQLPDHQGYHCASINAAAGVMAAILYRDATGEGQRVEVSMHESLLMAQETAMQAADILGTNRQRTGGGGATGFKMPGLGVYDTADGALYSMCTGNAGSGFQGLVELMRELDGPSEIHEEPLFSFVQERMNTGLLIQAMQDPEGAGEIIQTLRRIDDIATDFFRRHPTQTLYKRGQELRVLLGPVNTPQDISESEQLAARDWFRTVEDPARGRTLRYPGPPWLLQATPASLRRPAPLLGEHTNEVLTEAGVDGGALLAAGVAR